MLRPTIVTTLLFLSACCSMPAMYDCWICEQERAALAESTYETYEEEAAPANSAVAAKRLPAPPHTPADDAELAVVDLTNDERHAQGLSPLEIDDRLAAAARQHSQEMCELNYFSHRSPTPGLETLGQRGKGSGITSYRTLGENIASTTAPSPEAFISMWMNSEGHRKNILRKAFTHIGVGLYECGSTVYATQMFAGF